MALSYYSNCAAFQQLDSESTIIDELISQTELTPDYNQLQPFPDYQLFEPDDLFYSSENPNSNFLLHDFSNGFPYDNNTMVDPFNYPKLQKGCDYEQIYSENQFFINEPAFIDGLVENPNYLTIHDYYSPPAETLLISPTLPDFPTGPPSYSSGSCESVIKKEITAAGGGSGGSLSAQSIAARQRRRKITEKTQELGKLVPGGQKMNTAEMLQAAYKYIKFLQAQVGILEFVGSYHQENGEPWESNGALQVLLESSVIQEKLYTTEKCLVPKKFVQEISSDNQMIKSVDPQLFSVVKQEH